MDTPEPEAPAPIAAAPARRWFWQVPPPPADGDVPRPDESGTAGAAVVALFVAACALFGAVNGLHVVSALAGRAIFVEAQVVEAMFPGAGLGQLPVPIEAMPVWGWLERARLFGGTPLALILTVGVGLLTGALLIHLIHPRLRFYLRSNYFSWFKIVLAVVVSAVALTAAFWPLPEEVRRTHFPITRAALAGGVLLVLWHRHGWLHPDAAWPSYFSLAARLLVGAGIGVLGSRLLGHQPHGADLAFADAWSGAGLYCGEAWSSVTGWTVVTRAWFGLLVGGLTACLAPSALPLRRRLKTAVIVIAAAATVFAPMELQRRTAVRRHDLGRDLAQAAGEALAKTEPAAMELVHLGRTGRTTGITLAPGVSSLRLPLVPKAETLARGFLRSGPPTSALARAAAIQLHDQATWRWSVPAMLAVQEAQVHSPNATPGFVAPMVEAALIGADTPALRRAAGALLDPRRFAWPTPEAQGMLARLAWRWDRLDEMRPRLADVDPKALAEIDKLPAATFKRRISGRILLDGKPLGDVTVGVFMESDAAALYRPVAPPWPQRRVLAVADTDAAGRFAVDGLPGGVFRLVLRVSDERALFPAKIVEMEQGVRRIDLSESPSRDLGEIRLHAPRRRPAMQGA